MDVDKVVKLLAQTDGRDKLYKTAAGLAKIAADYSDKESGKKWKSIGKSIGDGRSLMRMGKFVGNVQKLQGFAAKGTLTSYQALEVLRVIGDFGYVLGDNLQYLAKYGVLPLDAAKTAANSKVFQFWGFVCAFLLDLWQLALLSAKKLEPKELAKKRHALVLSAIKNFADTLNCLAAVGYAKSFYKPGATFLGGCGVVSGGIATYTNWTKLSK
eukprot:CAMPEP_0174828844 /NCGR_PEP_ID=MMETSP1114-20130205/1566_1 /TAXON_ID=312471 /ORGANISM="Neobodo designis, Strain CCAP 1951/1" /LENGTH=212 /DNA_ID=CAMNT_0016062571 /DNA_START=46 /DNA_END=684 /DNA_ORIENTATION=-